MVNTYPYTGLHTGSRGTSFSGIAGRPLATHARWDSMPAMSPPRARTTALRRGHGRYDAANGQAGRSGPHLRCALRSYNTMRLSSLGLRQRLEMNENRCGARSLARCKTSFAKLTPTPDFKQRRTSSRAMSALGQNQTNGGIAREVRTWG